MKKIFLISLLSFLFYITDAQQYIETKKIFSATTDFNFTNEWQYVSTDLYLINSSKFDNLLNRINPGQKKRRKNRVVIKNILVTAQLDGLGDLDALTYPIFNFVVSEDADGNFQAQVTEPEAIRIVDNFPVTAIDDYIGAKINVQMYSDNNKSDLYKFIAEQLQSASTLTAISASDAALKTVGEIGNFMKKDAAGQQYQFESTIRFYQQTDFDRQLHSITIFVFQPSTATSNGFDTTNISRFFDTTSISIINEDKINQLINYNLYPYIVAVNYRSKYKAQISDDISFDMLRIRKTKNENNYQNGIISRDIYLQEKSLIDFLDIFANLQFHINNYELDYNAKITEDFTIQLFIILQDFWKLKNTYNITKQSFSGNPLFENEFKPLYERYLTQANLKFEGNSSLRAVRDHVETLYSLEVDGINSLDSVTREDFLRKLKTIEIPNRELNSDEATVTLEWIDKIENEQYTEIYTPQISYLSQLEINTQTYDKVQLLRLQAANSYCDLCKINVLMFETQFMNSYDKYLLNNAKNNYDTLINITKTNILEYSKKLSCIESNIDTSANIQHHTQIIINSLKITQDNINTLIQITNKLDANYTTVQEYSKATNEIITLSNSVEANLHSICTSDPQLCNCNTKYNRSNNNKTTNDR